MFAGWREQRCQHSRVENDCCPEDYLERLFFRFVAQKSLRNYGTRPSAKDAERM